MSLSPLAVLASGMLLDYVLISPMARTICFAVRLCCCLNNPRLPRLNLFCMGCQRRVALPTQTKIILELSRIVALIDNNCL